MSNNKNVNSVFYAELYHPIQAGSIDGTDILPHDSAVYRALRCYNAGLYDPLGDPKIVGDPYCTLFVGRLNHSTTDETLLQAMSKYGKVKNMRLVRHIVTGASRGYAFVEFETEREMRRAYKDAHHTFIDDSEIIVDYNRQQLMPGWIPRRLGGGLGGKKESGQLRFGGRERPFRAPLRQIPFDDLKRLGIPFPPEGRYLSRFEVPSPPRRKKIDTNGESESHKLKEDRQSHRVDQSLSPEPSSSRRRSSETIKDYSDSREKSGLRHLHPQKRNHDYDLDDKDSSQSQHKKDFFEEHKSSRQSHHHKRRSSSRDYSSDGKGTSEDKKYRSDKRHKSSRHTTRHERRSTRHDYSLDDNDSAGRRRSDKHTYSRKDERRSSRRNSPSVE